MQQVISVTQPLQLQIPEFLEQTVAQRVAFLPRLATAMVVLLVGWVVGVTAAGVVTGLTDPIELDRMMLETPLGRLMGGSEDAVSRTFATITRWFVYTIAILAAANVLAIATLSAWVQTRTSRTTSTSGWGPPPRRPRIHSDRG